MTLDACRFGCGDPVYGIFMMDRGCICYPNDRIQALCLQHAMKSEPIGEMEMIEIETTTTEDINSG